MKLFTTFDEQFIKSAEDDRLRASTLARLKTRRASYYFLGMIFILGSLGLELSGHGMGFGFPFFGLAAICVAFKHESDIRTLQMFEHFRERYDKPSV